MGNYNIVEGFRIIKQSESQKRKQNFIERKSTGKRKKLKKKK